MKSVLLTLALVFSTQGFGHARLAANSSIPPRNTNPGLKVGPCGLVPRTATPTEMQAGSQAVIRWEETINHPGSYFIEFSAAGDTGWQRLATIPDTQNGGGLPHLYSTTVTLPSTPCDACTLRLVQEMTDANPPTYYYSCGDLRLTSNTPPAPPGTPPPPPVTPPTDPVVPPPVPDTYGDDTLQGDCH